jgi:hypothetical protein
MAAPRKKPKLSHIDTSGRARIVDRSAEEALRQIFARNGYIRVPRDERRREIGTRYKKGWEVRLILKSQEELDGARRLLEQVRLKPGKPFLKARRYAQPVYGRKAVELFIGGRPID